MSMDVLRSGMQTTIQDLGRWGYQKYGILVGGTMDTDAARLSNRLVGNDEGEGVLEITMIGPVLRFTEDALIAICGADLTPLADNCPLPMGRPVYVSAGTTLRFVQPKRGCRAYLAVSGGFDIPKVMGSKSTYLQAHLGGYQGRPLQKGDVLSLCGLTTKGEKILSHLKAMGIVKSVDWYVMEPSLYYGTTQTIRLTKGLQYDAFATVSQGDLVKKEFTITTQADRMGYRLEGPTLQLKEPREMISEAATFGTMQVPKVMGSKSTYLQAHLGGYQGRPLQKGDVLSLCGLTTKGEKILSHLKAMGIVKSVDWYVMEPSLYYGTTQTIRLTKGLQYDAFATVSQGDLVKKEFTITTQADRMGYRLEGPTLQLKEPREMISEAATFGTMQVPGNGNPIILMADHQSVAGYLKIGQVCLVDLPALAQCGPGMKLRFSLITTDEAESLWRSHERYMNEIALALQCRFA